MKKAILTLQSFLEKIDYYRNELLYLFIKPYWPRKITPNHITWIRVAIGIFLFVGIFFLGVKNKGLILALFFTGVLTDLIDGPVARGTNRVTEFGAMLDSTADRILILPIAIYSLFIGEKWLLLALIISEIANALASMFYKSREMYLESNIFGKTKMVLQSVAFVVILITWPGLPPEFFIDLLWVSIILTILNIFIKIIELKDKKKINVPDIKIYHNK